MKVIVHQGDVEKALRKLRREMWKVRRLQRFFESPSERRRKARKSARLTRGK